LKGGQQEKRVSDLSTFPATGINHLIIECMARDAMLEGRPGATAIEVVCPSTASGTGLDFSPEGETARLSGVAPIQVVVSASMTVTVKSARGDLRVQRFDGDVNLESVRGSLRLSDLSGVVRVAQVDADLRAQGVADLRVMGNCNGDLRFDKGEHLAAESVAGDARIHDLGDAQLGRLRGDLWAEEVRGALQVVGAEGDVRVAHIDGLVTLRAVTGDLRAVALTGGLSAPQISGDAVLQGPYRGDEPYSLEAEGDVVLHLPADADVRVAVKAGGRIRSEAPLVPATDGSASFTSTLGRGSARINLVSGGDLRIHSRVQGGGREHSRAQFEASPDASHLGERIREQVSNSLAAAGIPVAAGLLTWGGRERPRPPKEPKSSRSPGPERPRPASATTKEQLAVLTMVEQGKITPGEADMLLKALGV
jgi:hypothetical protein